MDDEPRVSIGAATALEGNTDTKAFLFTRRPDYREFRHGRRHGRKRLPGHVGDGNLRRWPDQAPGLDEDYQFNKNRGRGTILNDD